ncbi:DoxX family protein [Streptomyces mirabilis]
MAIAAITFSALLALAALGAGIPKIRLKGDVPQQLQEHLGVSASLTRFIGLAEAAAAVGLVIGILWHPLGIAAAAGLAVLFAGAITYHRRAGDYANAATRGAAMAPAALGLVSLAAVATLSLSM